MRDEASPDYREVLGVRPGREDARFYLLLRSLLPYHAHPGGKADIDAWLAAREAIPDGGAHTTYLAWVSSVAPEFLEVPPFHPSYIPGEKFVEELQQRFAPLLTALLIDARMQGATVVPAAWGRDSVAASWRSRDAVNDPRHWRIYSAEGVVYYEGQTSAEFDALRAFARDLFAEQGHTPGINAAFHLWDVTKMLVADHDWGGVVDALSLAECLPPLHQRGRALLQSHQLVTAPSPGVRRAAASFLQCHPHIEVMPDLVEALLREEKCIVAAAQVVALRVMGGEAAFDALLDVATHATADDARRLASRALASVDSYPERQKRITRLVLDRNPRRRAAGTTALSETKHGSIYDEGGTLATAAEYRARMLR
jgi:hypothetical protein